MPLAWRGWPPRKIKLSSTRVVSSDQFVLPQHWDTQSRPPPKFDGSNDHQQRIERDQSRSRKSAQDDKWSFCLTAGRLCPTNQERQ